MIKAYLKKVVNAILNKNKQEYSLSGNTVLCPCCNGSFSTFLPYGLIKRANALCPKCFSLERHRLHWLFLEKELNLFNGPEKMTLLHVAPETIFYNKFIQLAHVKYYPIAKIEEGYPDVYPELTKNDDLTALSFEDNSFDFIYCSHVLEHIPDDGLAMKEIARVLKPNGKALLQVPLDINRSVTYEDFSITDPIEREKHFGQRDHVRVYGQDFKQRLEKSGLTVNVTDYRNKFDLNEQFKFGLMLHEDLYLCKKIA